MKAELGAGFEVTSDSEPQKVVLSDRPTVWTWNIRPKQEGKQSIVIVVSMPVVVDGMQQTVSTPLKDIPVEIAVTKPVANRIEELGLVMLPTLIVLGAGIFAYYAKSRVEQRERVISELGIQVKTNEMEIAEIRKRGEQEQSKRLSSPDWSRKPRQYPEIAEKEKLEMLGDELGRVKREKARLEGIPKWQFWRN